MLLYPGAERRGEGEFVYSGGMGGGVSACATPAIDHENKSEKRLEAWRWRKNGGAGKGRGIATTFLARDAKAEEQ